MRAFYETFLSIILLVAVIVIPAESWAASEQATDNFPKREKISAFLRVKDEIKTIKACLESIDGVFDKIVIIHSNEPDDGSVAFMNQWCGVRDYCEIHEYPYPVIPSHSKEYQDGAYSYQNSLAAYYEFGLQFFEPEEWVAKVDADQVYLTERLKAFFKPFREGKMDDTKQYGTRGYNSFVRKNELVIFKLGPINGGRDCFVVKRKNINSVGQASHYEKVKMSVPYATGSEPLWFHFMKSLRAEGVIRTNDEARDDEVRYLSRDEKALFEENIRPLLADSPYYQISVPTQD